MRLLLGLGIAVALLCASVHGQEFSFQETIDSKELFGLIDLDERTFRLSMSPVAAGELQFIGSETFIGSEMDLTTVEGITTLFRSTPVGSVFVEVDDLTSIAKITLMTTDPVRSEIFEPIYLNDLCSTPIPEPQSYLFVAGLGMLWFVRKLRG